MKKFVILALIITKSIFISAQGNTKKQINTVLDNWHKAATEANFDDYFNAMSSDAYFIGTDANENWDKPSFEAYAKPFFDKGKAWNFSALERNIYISDDQKFAWFDELLNTQMKICRGSGVLVLVDGKWKIKQYVLSMTIPNENSSEVISIKAPIEDALISKLTKK
jgi:hypothetical protein